MLMWLGRLTPTKDPLTFVDALSRLVDLDWTARLVGPDTVDADLSRTVRARIAAAGLADRVQVLGLRQGAELEQLWAASDLLVHTSRSETYGMVVGEALTRGIASIVASGTGAVEAQQGVGATFPPGDADALTAALRGWLGDPQLRERWRAAAKQRDVPDWAAATQVVAMALGR